MHDPRNIFDQAIFGEHEVRDKQIAFERYLFFGSNQATRLKEHRTMQYKHLVVD